MANTSHLLWTLFFLSTFLALTLEDCSAITALPKLFISQIKLSKMTQPSRPSASNPWQSRHYLYNYPSQLLSQTSSENINASISIQNFEANFLTQGIIFRLKQKKSAMSPTNMLITFQYYDSVWNSAAITVLLLDTVAYPSITFGQLSAFNNEGRISIDASAKLPASIKKTSAKSVVFLTGIRCMRKQSTNSLFQVQLTDNLDLSMGQITITARIGYNTILTEINFAYIVFGENKNYQVSGSYETFNNIGTEQHYRYLGDKVASGNYFLAGITSFNFMMGPGQFSLHYNLKQNSQNILELQSSLPLSILKIGIFRIGNTIANLCSNCPVKTVFNIGSSTSCASICPGTTIKDPSSKISKCLICSSQANFELVSGTCQCASGFSYINSECLSNEQSKFVGDELKPTFSRSDFDCVDPNSRRDQKLAKCVCKPGFQLNQQQTCTSICLGGFYDGQKCVNCPQGTYPWNIRQTCLPCSSDCISCGSQYSCEMCKQGFEVNNFGKCQQTCGDGITVNAQCDDRNYQDGDGCSSQCQIQLGYTCNYDQSQGRSVCSNQIYSLKFRQPNLSSNNMIISFEMTPPPQKYYSQKELESKIRIKYISSPPHNTFLAQYPGNLSTFTIVCAYPGNYPLDPAILDIQIQDPAGKLHSQLVKKQFIFDGRSLSRRNSFRSQTDILK